MCSLAQGCFAQARANRTRAYIAANRMADFSWVGFFCSGIRLGSRRTRNQTINQGIMVSNIRIVTGGAAETKSPGATTAISTNTRTNTTVEAIMITMAGARQSAGSLRAWRGEL